MNYFPRKKIRELKKRKNTWVKIPFWVAGVLLVLAGGFFLSYRYLVNPPSKAATEKVNLSFQIERTEYWSSKVQQDLDSLEKISSLYSDFKDLRASVEGKIDKLWQHRSLSYPGDYLRGNDDVQGYVMHPDIAGGDQYSALTSSLPHYYYITTLVNRKKIDRLAHYDSWVKYAPFEMQSQRKIKVNVLGYPSRYGTSTKWENYEPILDRSALAVYDSDLNVTKNNLEVDSGKWFLLGSLYDWQNFENNTFAPTSSKVSKKNAFFVPGRDYSKDWKGTKIQYAGNNFDATYVPGFTESKIGSTIKINNQTPAQAGYDVSVVLAKNYSGSEPDQGVTKSSSAQWSEKRASGKCDYFGAWLNQENNVWVKITKKENQSGGQESVPAEPSNKTNEEVPSETPKGETATPETSVAGDLDGDKDVDLDDFASWIIFWNEYNQSH